MTDIEKSVDIKERPEKHRHNFTDLIACCTIDGALDMELMELHQMYASTGQNGGQQCDVTSGPCACGAWH